MMGIGGGGNAGLGDLKTIAMGAVTQVTDAILGTLNGIFNQIKGFTEALNPALVAQISRAFRDLNAVIGIVAQEVAAMLQPIVRGVADALLPAMRALVPVVGMVAASFEAFLQPAIDLMAKAFEAMLPLQQAFASMLTTMVEPVRLVVQVLSGLLGAVMPLIQAYATFQKIIMSLISVIVTGLMVALMPIILPLQIIGTILGEVMNVVMQLIDMALAPFMEITKLVAGVMTDLMRVVQILMQVFQAVMKAISEAVLGAMGASGIGSIKDISQSLQDAFRKLMKAVLLAVATFMKLVGFKSGLDAMIKAMVGARGVSTGLAVAESPAFKQIGDLGKDIALQAFVASGEGSKNKKAEDWMAEIATELKQMAATDTGQSILDELKNDFPKKLARALREELMGSQNGTVFNAVANPIGVILESWKRRAAR